MSMGEEEVAGKLPGIRTKSRDEPRRLAPGSPLAIPIGNHTSWKNSRRGWVGKEKSIRERMKKR